MKTRKQGAVDKRKKNREGETPGSKDERGARAGRGEGEGRKTPGEKRKTEEEREEEKQEKTEGDCGEESGAPKRGGREKQQSGGRRGRRKNERKGGDAEAGERGKKGRAKGGIQTRSRRRAANGAKTSGEGRSGRATEAKTQKARTETGKVGENLDDQASGAHGREVRLAYGHHGNKRPRERLGVRSASLLCCISTLINDVHKKTLQDSHKRKNTGN